MKVTFGNLMVTISPLIEKAIPSLDELKTYLRKCFRELRPQLSLSKSFEDVMEIVEDKCTIINICCLEAIIDHYNITEAKQHIAEFKTEVDIFCQKLKADVCCDQNFTVCSFSHHLICESIEFILDWEADKYTLSHIKDLLSKAFKGMAKSVQVKVIKEGYSIMVTCYAPQYMMDSLLMTAEENIDLLKEIGVIKLTIGFNTIYDKRKRDEVRNK